MSNVTNGVTNIIMSIIKLFLLRSYVERLCPEVVFLIKLESFFLLVCIKYKIT